VKIKLDLSKFKLKHKDEKTATLIHPEGHIFKIAVNALHPENRKHLEGIEKHEPKPAVMADGGKVKADEPGSASPQNPMPPMPKAKAMMADGGDPAEQIPSAEISPMPVPTVPEPNATPVSLDLNNTPMASPEQFAQNQQALPPEAQQAMQAPQSPASAPQAQQPGVQQPSEAPKPNPEVQGIAKSITDGAVTQTALQNPHDPYGNETYNKAYVAGLAEQKQGLNTATAGLAQQGAAQAEAADASIKAIQENKQTYDDHFKTLDNERQAFQQDIINGHIDPNRYLGSMSTGDRIQSAVGLILGGIGSAHTGGSNPALDFLNKQIDRDIDVQKADLGKKESLLQFNMRQFGNLRDATDMTRVMQMDMVSQQLKAAAARTEGTLAKAHATQAAGQLDMQAAPIVSNIAMRRSLLGNGSGSDAPPENKIRALIQNPVEQDKYNAELKSAKIAAKTRDNLLEAYDKVAKLQTFSERFGSPFQSSRQIDALVEPLVAALSKETAGKYTETDAKAIKALFTKLRDNPETVGKNRVALDKITSEKMEYPMLTPLGIDPMKLSRYGSNGTGSPEQQASRQALNPQQQSFLDWARKNPSNEKAKAIIENLKKLTQ
jgi:hypothetical protein